MTGIDTPTDRFESSYDPTPTEDADRAVPDLAVGPDPLWEPPRTVVPEGEEAVRCRHCGQPFGTERARTLHLGEAHVGTLTDDEARAVAEAREAEADDLFVYHLKVVAAIVLLLMGLAYVYAFVLS